jgi:hypothetical protein
MWTNTKSKPDLRLVVVLSDVDKVVDLLLKDGVVVVAFSAPQLILVLDQLLHTSRRQSKYHNI